MRTLVSQITLHKLEVFRLVAQFESMSRAAERLGLAQPVVTAHVRSLEDKLGVRLTMRQGRWIRLTEQGHRVNAWAREVINRTRELEREITDSDPEAAGRLVVSTSMSFGSYVFPSVLAAFRRHQPKGEITTEVSTPQLAVNTVRDGASDMALTILDAHLDTIGLNVEQISRDRLVLVAARGSRHCGAHLDWEAMSGTPFITAQRESPRWETEDRALRERGVSNRNVVLEVGHAEAMKRAVREDLGVCFLFASAVQDELDHDMLRLVETPGIDIHVPLFLVSKRGKRFSAFQAQFLEFLRGHFAVR